jgi:hypothetical protein
MSLKAFHVFFIVVSILLLAGMAAWGVNDHLTHGSPTNLAMGAGSGVLSLGLLVYLRSFLKKLKGVSYL